MSSGGYGRPGNGWDQPQPKAKRIKSAEGQTAATSERSPLDTAEGRKEHFFTCVGKSWQNETLPEQAWVWNQGRNDLTQRKVAMERVLSEMKSMTRAPQSLAGRCMYDTSDSEDEHDNRKELTHQHIQFIKALPYCTPLDAGFCVVPYRKGDDDHCHCPCGRSTQPWRNMSNIKDGTFDPCDETSFRPNAFMDHLKEKGGEGNAIKDIAHHAVWRYLTCLYGDWFGPRKSTFSSYFFDSTHMSQNTCLSSFALGFGHKALYKPLEKKWLDADYEERRILAAHLEKERVENEKLKLEVQKKEEEKERFRMLSKDQQKKIEDMELERKELGINKKETPSLTAQQVKGYKRMVMANFALMKDMTGLKTPLKISVLTKSQSIEDGGKSVGFSLQKFFDDLFDSTPSNSNKARLALFGKEDDSNKIARLVLSTWEVTYEKLERSDNTRERKELKRDTVIDEGGASRQFLSDVFKQLDSLRIKDGTVKLFQKSSGGLKPNTDETLERRVKRKASSPKEQADLTERGRAYLRGIGRIMLHAFVHDLTLPKMLPDFFIKVELHGYNESYHRDDILHHVEGGELMASTENHLSWLLSEECDERDSCKNRWTTDSIFKEYIPKEFIRSRTILLGGLSEGLSIGKPSQKAVEHGCSLASSLEMVPFEAIQKMWFSPPKIEVDHVISVLVPRYKIIADETWDGTEEERVERQREQEAFFEGNLKRYLRENAQKDRAFLQRFVECTTGYNYLPYDVSQDEGEVKDFSITVEFDDHLDPFGYPRFHTCTLEAVIPGNPIFYTDYGSFCQRMNDAISQVYNQFNMQ